MTKVTVDQVVEFFLYAKEVHPSPNPNPKPKPKPNPNPNPNPNQDSGMDKALVDFAALVARDLARREAYGTALLPLLCELTDLRTSLHRHAVTPLPLPLPLPLPQ